ncbi:hypothetical protein K2X05_00405 [bacterium]|nr:hypothetical protein [bacterium]
MSKKITLILASLLMLNQFVFAENVSLTPSTTIVLKKGSDHEVILPEMTESTEFIGDWRAVTKLAVARQYKKIRFSPYKTGNGTLTVYNAIGKPIFEYHLVVQ